MATLAQFATLEEAKAFEQVTYRKIGGNEASQILSINGAIDSIEANVNNATVIELVQGMPTTIGALCRTIVRTIQGGSFATDPATDEGRANRGGNTVLIGAGIITQAQSDDFFAKAETRTQPFANATLHEFQVAKGTVAKKALPVSANGDAVFINVTTACERHSPNITLANGTRIGAFFQVANTGYYFAQIPNEYRGQSYFVDDSYGAIA